MRMSGKKFRFIIRCMTFDNKDTTEIRSEIDKLATVRELITFFIENCEKHYHPLPSWPKCDHRRNVACISFRQYILSKPNKYGIKIFCLSEAKLYHTANIDTDFWIS